MLLWWTSDSVPLYQYYSERRVQVQGYVNHTGIGKRIELAKQLLLNGMN